MDSNNKFFISEVSIWEINVKISMCNVLKEKTTKDLFESYDMFLDVPILT